MKRNAGWAMSREKCRIAVVAPASRISADVADKVRALAGSLYPDGGAEIFFHPQCFLSHGHFAGDDEARARAFLDVANDDNTEAVWFARGGYGSCRLVEQVIGGLKEPSKRKTYLGYSDCGALLAALYGVGLRAVAHGPMAQDILRDGGDAAIRRALAWMVDRAPEALEPAVNGSNKTAAFNVTVLSQLLGTPLQPALDGHVLMLEEVSEAMYRIDRSLFHITSNPGIRRVAGIRLGRCSDITPNQPDFAMNEEEVARHWCDKSGIPWLGRADIGHDADNKIVPFGSSA
ncbi:MAG: muramoyltetrapeptide carboxypeptidase [Bradyrhizobium sp.]|nr:muramoyltetrapeptide carboxypeptidase [Bradyrhizobium sp.]